MHAFMYVIQQLSFPNSTFYRVFFTGIRIAVEAGSVLTYFGPSGFGYVFDNILEICTFNGFLVG